MLYPVESVMQSGKLAALARGEVVGILGDTEVIGTAADQPGPPILLSGANNLGGLKEGTLIFCLLQVREKANRLAYRGLQPYQRFPVLLRRRSDLWRPLSPKRRDPSFVHRSSWISAIRKTMTEQCSEVAESNCTLKQCEDNASVIHCSQIYRYICGPCDSTTISRDAHPRHAHEDQRPSHRVDRFPRRLRN